MKNSTSNASIFKYAFLNSLPVMFGYIFLGTAYGICLQQAGYGVLWAFLTSVFIFAGSAQFAIATMVAFGTSLPTIALMVLFINSRHIFYGISFIDEFKKMKQYPYMIFSLSDETYSVLTLCNKDPMLHANNNQAMFLIALFDQCYWIIGSVIGSICGQLIPIDFTGIDFSMTALFVVILVDNIRNGKDDKSVLFAALCGLICGTACLFIFGASKFILPALIVTVFVLSTKTMFERKPVVLSGVESENQLESNQPATQNSTQNSTEEKN